MPTRLLQFIKSIKIGDHIYSMLEKRIQTRTRELSALYAITSTVSNSLDLDKVLNSALDKALETTRAQMGALYLIDDERKYLSLTAHRGYPSEFLEATTRIELSSGNGLIEKVAISGRPAIIGDTSEHPDVGKTTLLEASSLAVIPLRSGGRVLGVLELVSRKRHNFPPEEVDLLSAIGDQIGIAVDNARLFEETRRFSVTDALTGVYNRHYLNQMFEREIKRAKRQNTKLSVLMADIDDLKYYNDRFGHLVGDEILKEIARILAKTVRETDVVTRYGGDEFLILMPETDEGAAHVALSRIDKALKEWNLAGGFEGTTVNLSMGVKTADGADLDEIIKAADEEMYRTKRKRTSGHGS
jgi:diguanylate cyclase (GGDEF)-like protein